MGNIIRSTSTGGRPVDEKNESTGSLVRTLQIRITERIDGVIEKYLDEQGGENEVNMKVVDSTREAIRDTHLNLNAKRHKPGGH
ncbi:hypothetical protein RUM44_005426 [Polyplax serrata]|uniref:Uncharacterized protein n=1 Tax=Polyplax serrata TaxID=468196 RepID=A0ABR1AWP9_POLSC